VQLTFLSLLIVTDRPPAFFATLIVQRCFRLNTKQNQTAQAVSVLLFLFQLSLSLPRCLPLLLLLSSLLLLLSPTSLSVFPPRCLGKHWMRRAAYLLHFYACSRSLFFFFFFFFFSPLRARSPCLPARPPASLLPCFPLSFSQSMINGRTADRSPLSLSRRERRPRALSIGL
jgi:hypothetical protein